MRRLLSMFLFAVSLLLQFPGVVAAANFVLQGRVNDSNGRGVEGAEVFVYNSSQTRRPADFISPPTDRAGGYRTELPAGQYWVVARVRDGAAYGPLAMGKRHSGEAQSIEGEAGSEVTLDFTVADVREMARSRRKTAGDYHSVEGRILGPDGKPVEGAYAFARTAETGSEVPAYISPGTEADGRYILYLPAGRSCLGAAVTYPPERGAVCTELILDESTLDIAKELRLQYIGKEVIEENHKGKEID